ncbi:MAG: class I SAM-dependent RNA methyltransferase [Clostridiales bacterium]|nr:class I SAM-dependent RNA methyltransferase [Clostridiales bacterium]
MKYTMAAPCLFGLESLVRQELCDMGAENVRAENGRVFFDGGENILARANICSRFAERIFILIGEFDAFSFDELFENTKALPWSDYIGRNDAFPVRGYSIDSKLHSVPDCQKIIKKAVVESLKTRWSVEIFSETEDMYKIRFSIIKNRVLMFLDSSGDALHKRGYRKISNAAPIKETLAAAMCALSRLKPYHTLYDPFCGSGTIVIEGALMAKNIAPGIGRNFAAQGWNFIANSAWTDEFERAKSLEINSADFYAFASDIDKKAVELTAHNAALAGVGAQISAVVRKIDDFELESDSATLITNPPYGERMLDFKEVHEIYKTMGALFKPGRGRSYGIISPDEEFEKFFARRADKRRKLYNGMIKCQYYMYFKN